MSTYVSYTQTVSKNYQSQRYEFGFQLVDVVNNGAAVSRAQDLCAAVVRHRLGVKTGSTRKQLDALAKEFFACSWQELSTGVADGDEEV